MNTKDFMPDDAVIAAIRQDIEAYERERASAPARLRLTG